MQGEDGMVFLQPLVFLKIILQKSMDLVPFAEMVKIDGDGMTNQEMERGFAANASLKIQETGSAL